MTGPLCPTRPILLAALLVVAALLPLTSRATAPAGPHGLDVREFTCPIGGEKFSQDVGYISLGFVPFPDGSWLGDFRIDVQIPECPGNGLVLILDIDAIRKSSRMEYLTYSPEQLARLPALIGSDAYRQLKGKSRYERAQWLATQLGLPAATRWQLLVRSSWTTSDPAERKRLVTRIVDEGPALIDAMDSTDTDKRRQRLLVANALRELGRFDASNALLASILASLSTDADVDDPNGTRKLRFEASRMRAVNAHHDDDRFPVELSDEKWAAGFCQGGPSLPATSAKNGSDNPLMTITRQYAPTTANGKAACARLDQQQQAQVQAAEETRRLLEHPDDLQRQCKAIPEGQYSADLAHACHYVQIQQDDKEGHDLALHHPRQVAADCETTRRRDRKGPLAYACITYESSVGVALETLIVGDDQAYAVICGTSHPELAFYAQQACFSAGFERQRRAVAKWLVDPAALDAACAKRSPADPDENLQSACEERRSDLQRAQIRRFSADPAALDATCAKLSPEDPNQNLQQACRGRRDILEKAQIERLVANPAAYKATCASIEQQLSHAEPMRIILSSGIEHVCSQARIRLLATDQPAYDATCAAIEKQHALAPSKLADTDSGNDFTCGQARIERRINEEKSKAALTAKPEPSEKPPHTADVRNQHDNLGAASDLTHAALEAAQRIITAAIAAGTYPKHKPGDVL